MKRIIIVAALFAALLPTLAQEKLSREECLKYAFATSVNLKEMLNTPIPTDPDVKRAVGVKDGDYGGMILPETKLTSEVFAKAGKEAKPVGQLWLLKLSPIHDGKVVPVSKLRMVHLKGADEEGDAACCALGVRQSGESGLELLVYGKDREPILAVPLKNITPSGSQENPIEVSSERENDSGTVILKIVGRYEARFSVTDPEQN